MLPIVCDLVEELQGTVRLRLCKKDNSRREAPVVLCLQLRAVGVDLVQALEGEGRAWLGSGLGLGLRLGLELRVLP